LRILSRRRDFLQFLGDAACAGADRIVSFAAIEGRRRGMLNQSAMTEDAAALAGGQVRREMSMTLATFEAIELDGRERLSAIASTIAAAAMKRHGEGREAFLAHLFELARPAVPADEIVLPPSRGEPNRACIAEGLAVLDTGLDRITMILLDSGGARQANLVESTMLARLLAPHGPQAARRALATVGRAIAEPNFPHGEVIVVSSPDEPFRAAA
jgi:hypothetical protein